MCRSSLWLRSSRFGLWRRGRKRNRKKHYTEDAERAEDTEKTGDWRECLSHQRLQIQGAGVGNAGFAGVGAFDSADAEEFFSAAFEVGFYGFYVGRGDDQDHADAHVEGLQEFVGFDFAEAGEEFEDGRDGPRG